MSDYQDHNRAAWDREVERGNPWTRPVTSQQVAAARRGDWRVVLTNQLPVPRHWFPPLAGSDGLCLGGGGGQQGPILAAAGARVTVFDLSPQQLERDRQVAERDGLELTVEEGDMGDLNCFDDDSFDWIFNPVSNCFVPEVRGVWRECARVLRGGGVLMTGFANPTLFLFEEGDESLVVRHGLPYADSEALPAEVLAERRDPLVYGHTLDDQIGGQLAAGFQLTDLYEDRDPDEALSRYIANYLATRAVLTP
ncbi:MAG: class I SAM-dependent methyltransferase [Acidobacteriota bacterium]